MAGCALESLAVRPHLRLLHLCYPMPMGHALRTAYAILDDVIARKGADGFLIDIEHEVISGRRLTEIAQAEGLMYSVLWNWLRNEPERLERYRAALKGYGDALIAETVGIADGSGDAKLMVDTRLKIAGKLDKKVWGDEKESTAAGITVVVQRGLTAEVTTGGVLTLGPSENKGYTVSGVTVDGRD